MRRTILLSGILTAFVWPVCAQAAIVYEVIDLGTDISPEQFVNIIKEHKPKLIGMSALLSTTMRSMKDTVEAIEKEGLRDQVKIMIGGAPVTQKFADEIGADGYAPDAASAVDIAKTVLGAA